MRQQPCMPTALPSSSRSTSSSPLTFCNARGREYSSFLLSIGLDKSERPLGLLISRGLSGVTSGGWRVSLSQQIWFWSSAYEAFWVFKNSTSRAIQTYWEPFTVQILKFVLISRYYGKVVFADEEVVSVDVITTNGTRWFTFKWIEIKRRYIS